MPLVTSTEMFKKAYEGGYAIGAFNVNNMETIQGIVSAAKEENAPLILQVSSGARKYANPIYLRHLIEAAVQINGSGGRHAKNSGEIGILLGLSIGTQKSYVEHRSSNYRFLCLPHKLNGAKMRSNFVWPSYFGGTKGEVMLEICPSVNRSVASKSLSQRERCAMHEANHGKCQ